MRWMSFLSVLALTVVLAWTSTASAQEKKFLLELNSASDSGSGCRVSFVAFNGTGQALEKTSYEVVVFDSQGLVADFLILDFGRLPVNKTRVVLFDLNKHACGTISRLLINGAVECETATGPSELCLDSLTTTARTQIEFGT